MDKKIVRGLIIIAVAVVLAIAIALPAGAGPSKAKTYTLTDFNTYVLDANGDYKEVYCKFAKLTLLDDKASETYHCEFLPESDAVLPDSAADGPAELGAECTRGRQDQAQRKSDREHSLHLETPREGA